MSKSLFNIKLSKSLQKHGAQEKLVQDISDHFLAGVGNMAKLQKDEKMVDMVEDICQIVESELPRKNKLRINKKDVVLSIFSRLFPDMSDLDKTQLNRDIERFVKHGLKRVSRLRRLFRWAMSLVCAPKDERRPERAPL
jgi:hypothetical protein